MQSKQPLSGLDGAHQMVSQGARKKKEKFGWFYRCLSVFIRGSQLNRCSLELPSAQPQGVANYDQIRHTHRGRAKDWTHKSESRQRDSQGIVEERPKQVLVNRSQSGAGQSETFRNRLYFGLQEDDICGFP